MIVSFLVATAAAGAPLVAAQQSRAPSLLAIEARHVVLADGRTLENGVILIENGLVRAVGADVAIPERAGVLVHDGFASAGLIALHSYSGAAVGMRDSTRAILPDLRMSLAFDPEHEDFSKALAQGITSVVLTPPPQSLAGGASAVVKTFGGKVVRDEAQLSLGFSSEALSDNRFPTSYAGAVAELEEHFAKPAGTVAKAADGKLPVLFETRSRQDVQRAIAFAMKHGLTGAINGADWAGELVRDIQRAKLAVVCAPLEIGELSRTLRAVRALAEAGVPFGFGLDAPWYDPAALRFSAASCVRGGVPRADAWRGLTSHAASILGLGDRIGSLEKGREADIVLWSGDPLDLGSRVEAVYVDGVRAFGAEK